MHGSDLGRLELAARSEPANADGWFRLGLAQLDGGLIEAAEITFRRVLSLDARHAKAGINLGMVLQFLGKSDEAETWYRNALAVDPDLAQGWFNLGANLLARGRARGAVEALRRATSLAPDRGDWHAALASALAAALRAPQALEAARTAARLAPRLAEPHEQLAAALQRLGDCAAAIAACRAAGGLGLDTQFLQSCLLDSLGRMAQPGPGPVFEAHRDWGRRYAGMAADWPPGKSGGSERALRIGFLAPDFRHPAIACGLQPVLAWHDRALHSIFCYSDVEAEDVVSWRLRGKDVTWANTSGLDDERLAARIREDRIDILVDMGGHRMGGRRMPVLARRPAPVQATWLGYAGTTGLPAIDYRITGARNAPPGTDAWYTEKLVRLPAGELSFRPDRWCAGRGSMSRPPDAPIVFGSLHQLDSLTPDTLALWSRLLHRVPDAMLLLAVPEGAIDFLSARLAAAGIGTHRTELVECIAGRAAPSLLERIDVCLDAVPCACPATVLHSLWMGTPVVAMRGATEAANSRASLLEELGLAEWAAADEDAYVATAAALAGDRPRLRRLREDLRGALERSPVLDAEGFTRGLESAFRLMWRRYCAGQPAGPLRIEAPGRARPERPSPGLRAQSGPCRVVVDGVFFQDYSSGIGRLWSSLLGEWSRSGFAENVVLLDRGGSAPKIGGVRRRVVARHSYGQLAQDREALQRACDAERATVFVSTYYTRPLSAPSMMMVYDMIPEVFGVDLRAPAWQEKTECILNARRYVAISASTARDLSDIYPAIDPRRIRVAHCGVAPHFRPGGAGEIDAFRRRHGIAKPYFLLVGGRGGGYKNARAFFRAFALLPERSRFAVVWVGGEQPLDAEESALCAGSEVYPLRLGDEELRSAYGAAAALAFPSAYEGFGMPVVEAMACACPVVTTSSASLPEVAGDAAIMVTPTDIDELAQALQRVLRPSVRDDLVRRGLVQAQNFSWSRMAEIVAAELAAVD